MASVARMTVEEFELLNGILSEYFGLHFPDHKREVLEFNLKQRVEELRLQTFMEYYHRIQLDPKSEKEALARAVTNNETYFFRETNQFEALFNLGLGDLKSGAAVPGALRILCAGCSSGEEAYTLNFYAKENQFRAWGTSFSIDAFDLDTRRLEMAKAATYTENSFRFTSPDQIAKYFVQSGGSSYAVKPVYREGISFTWGNILELHTYYRLQPYDALFCRNVLIYFSELSLRMAVENFARCLRPGGLLFLGHSESIIGVNRAFEPIRLGNCIIYRRLGYVRP